MRAAGITTFGADVELLELPDPRPPAADELLIRVRAAAVANWDDVVRQGNWDIGGSLPLALGVEVAGEVLTAGAAARRFAAGDAVMAHPLPLRDQGAWAEQMLIPAEAAAPKPATVEWEEAAAFPVPALTAHQVLTEALEIQPGETLLVHGGGGVTGRLLIALVGRAGARVFATASERSADRLRAVGAEAVFDYRDAAWQDALRERGRRPTARLGSVAREPRAANRRCLGRHTRGRCRRTRWRGRRDPHGSNRAPASGPP
jgi:NADPH:quinone reductase-like Zn-dependent oxidoreductase